MKSALVSIVCAATFAAVPAFAAPLEASLAARDLTAAQAALIPSATPVTGCPLSLTATRGSLYTDGAPQLVTYDGTVTAQPAAAWISQSTLVVPRTCGGRYLLSVSFTKDTGAGSCLAGRTGTGDDVVIDMFRTRAGATVKLSPGNGAWAGHSSGVRPMGAVTFVAILNEGDHITTWSRADANRPRCMHNIVFTAATLP